MNKFEVGKKYDVKLSQCKRFGEVVGYIEVISFEEHEIDYRQTSIKDCFIGECATMTYKAYTNTIKGKEYTTKVFANLNSENWCKNFQVEKEEMWFQPCKRNYLTIEA